MTAAYVLVINMFIAAIFAVAFGTVAATIRPSRGAGWMAAGYATGVFYAALQFVSAQYHPLLLGMITFLTYLLAVGLCVVGVARHYRVAPPWREMAVLTGISLIASPLLVELYDQSLAGVALYQLPYALMQLLCGLVILRAGRRQTLDRLLLGLQFVCASTYMLRPAIGLFVGEPGTADIYITTTYAAVSQTLGAVSLVSLALVLLLVMMRDTTEEMTTRSETDALSGLLNRGGFEQRAAAAFSECVGKDLPLTVVTADLDHFKRINDSFGHAAGDRVIAAFAKVLAETAPHGAVLGRLGGEEFTVLLPGLPLATGALYAESVRIAFHQLRLLGETEALSASFGAVRRCPDESFADLLRRADKALYKAKETGRNRVCRVDNAVAGAVPIPAEDQPHRHSPAA